MIASLCHICGLPIEQPMGHNLWCHHCEPLLKQSAPRCARCGLEMLTSAVTCGHCLLSPPPWQRLYCLGDYRYPLSSFIRQIKQHKRVWLLAPLAQMLSQAVEQPAQSLVTVPMLHHRELWRGFNLSELLAHQLSQHLPVERTYTKVFRKHRNTPTQKNLCREARLNNVRRAFSLRTAPDINHVAIIDDVVTTGATACHLSELLLDVGVEKIDIYCLCRTPKPSQK